MTIARLPRRPLTTIANSEEVYNLTFDKQDRFVVTLVDLQTDPPIPGKEAFIDLELPSQAIARSTFARLTAADPNDNWVTLMTMFINTSAKPGRVRRRFEHDYLPLSRID